MVAIPVQRAVMRPITFACPFFMPLQKGLPVQVLPRFVDNVSVQLTVPLAVGLQFHKFARIRRRLLVTVKAAHGDLGTRVVWWKGKKPV